VTTHANWFPIEGFLGTGAPFVADVNLVVQVVMATALVMGALFAKQKRYRAHAVTQTTVVLLNSVMIATVMWPAMRQQVLPAFPTVFGRWYFAVASIHAIVGITAEVLGLYILLVAATNLLPHWLRFRNWKRWMRTELVVWWVALLSGIGTYYAWYIAPFR
jgi:uncharacterized membrane protein YozB (DUF420 family)